MLKGFLIQDLLDNYGVRIDTPEKLKNKMQFSRLEDITDRRNAQPRFHVERVIRRVKLFRILKAVIPIFCQRYGKFAAF